MNLNSETEKINSQSSADIDLRHIAICWEPFYLKQLRRGFIIEPEFENRGNVMFVKNFNEREKKCFSELLLIMSTIDGDLSQEEMSFVDTYLDEMGLATLPSSIRSIDDIAAELIKSERSTLYAVFFELSMAARADSKIEKTEKGLLKDLSSLLRIPSEKASEIEKAAEKLSEAHKAIETAFS